MTVEAPKVGDKAPIRDARGKVVSAGRWVRVEYETPEGTKKSFLTVKEEKPEKPEEKVEVVLPDLDPDELWWLKD